MAISSSNKTSSARMGDPDKTGDLSAAAAAAAPSKPHKRSARGSDVAKREKQERRAARKQAVSASHSTRKSVAGAPVASGSPRAKGGKAPRPVQQDLMRYASDNAVVRWLYALTTGPRRYLFYGAVVALVLVGIYGPVKDFYIARRTVMILEEQTAIREEYNETLGDEVGSLMSQEGIEDTARKDLGMVMPGEQTITVEGLDSEGNPVVVDPSKPAEEGEGASGEASAEDPAKADSDKDSQPLKGADAANKDKTGSSAAAADPSKKPMTSAEVEAAERAVLENSPWYWKVLDVLFGFDGAKGMAVVSTGEKE